MQVIRRLGQAASLSSSWVVLFRYVVAIFLTGFSPGAMAVESAASDAVLASAPPSISHALADTPVEVGTATLPNGLEIYVYEDHSAPIVAVQVWYRVGSRDEPVGLRGMAHLLEHMMFKGSPRVGPEEHARLIDQVGGDANAYTATDVTVYINKVPSTHLDLVLELEAERMVNLRMTDEHLSSEREVVKEEYRLGLENSPITQAFNAFHGIALANTPYAWTPYGFIDELDAITLADLEAFYRQNYGPNNAVLVVAGDTDLHTVVEMAQAYFGPLAPIEPPTRPSFQLPANDVAVWTEMLFPIQLPAIIGGYVIPGLVSPDMEALQVAGLILSGGESTRIHQKMVRQTQLAVAALGFPQQYRDVGLFLAIALFLPHVDAKTVAQALQAEIENLTNGVTPQELQMAKNQAAAHFAFSLDTLDGVAQAIGSAVVLEGGLEKFTRGLDPYFALTEADIVRVAQQHLRPENLSIVQVLPAPVTKEE